MNSKRPTFPCPWFFPSFLRAVSTKSRNQVPSKGVPPKLLEAARIDYSLRTARSFSWVQQPRTLSRRAIGLAISQEKIGKRLSRPEVVPALRYLRALAVPWLEFGKMPWDAKKATLGTERLKNNPSTHLVTVPHLALAGSTRGRSSVKSSGGLLWCISSSPFRFQQNWEHSGERRGTFGEKVREVMCVCVCVCR